jgi:hypothetical protein
MAEAKQKGSPQTAAKRRRTPAAKSKSQDGSASSRSATDSGGTTEPKRRSRPKAGKGVGQAVKAARLPLLAGGAAIAGAAGGAVLASRQAHRHGGLTDAVRKIESDDIARAARRVGEVSARVGQFAADFQRARESSNGAANGKHRSPVEVVLQGLTARH